MKLMLIRLFNSDLYISYIKVPVSLNQSGLSCRNQVLDPTQYRRLVYINQMVPLDWFLMRNVFSHNLFTGEY